MAECHPVAFRWVMQARERGATVIHVDPRFTRTSAVANIHVPIRPGSDIVFLGAIIRYILENERYFKEYVVHYTNAAAIIDRGISRHGRSRRPFQRDATRRVNVDPWAYQGEKKITTFAEDPACVFPDPEAPLCALHARNGRRDLRHSDQAILQSSRNTLQ